MTCRTEVKKGRAEDCVLADMLTPEERRAYVESHSEAYNKKSGVEKTFRYNVIFDVANTYHISISPFSAYKFSHFYGGE